ncbi:MAG: DUF997 family protein [Planctomycetaceae bacterium]
MSDLTPEQLAEYEPDPIFVSSRREAKWILLMWIACLIWTMAICDTFGYPKAVNPDEFPLVLGIPMWVAVGIVFPWLVANAVTIWFCLAYMQDCDLQEPVSDENASKETA